MVEGIDPRDGEQLVIEPGERLAPEVPTRRIRLTLDVQRLDLDVLHPGIPICADIWFDGAGMVHALSGEIVSLEDVSPAEMEAERLRAELEEAQAELESLRDPRMPRPGEDLGEYVSRYLTDFPMTAQEASELMASARKAIDATKPKRASSRGKRRP